MARQVPTPDARHYGRRGATKTRPERPSAMTKELRDAAADDEITIGEEPSGGARVGKGEKERGRPRLRREPVGGCHGPLPTSRKSAQSTPKRTEAWKPPATGIAVQFDPVEEAVTSPLQLGKARIDRHRATTMAAAENGGAPNTVPRDVAAVAAVGERRPLSVALRLATAVLSLASFAVMASARTSGWDGDHFDRYDQYRSVISPAYST
ncbi:hypothetical protein TRIUR3_15298 [Triticum urartu]|uniref:CASP-like protein n=1 Tax=Triticum urartu TaxID=4572 RepID=M8A328_TRIUA|nr:hypothetical protein TRIUR3_15298 [Triticum urartu]